jgi:hypothetical protein
MAAWARRLVAPEPPADLGNIPIRFAATATPWFRLARREFTSPVNWSREGRHRFDSPTAKWGVCYAAESVTAAFQEIWGDEIHRGRRLDWQEVEAMVAWQINVAPGLRTIELAGETLAVLKGTLQCFVGDYSKSQRWGQALMAHPADLDGLQYFGRRSGRTCLALFGDAKSPKAHHAALSAKRLGPMVNWQGLWTFFDRIQVRVAHAPSVPPLADWA